MTFVKESINWKTAYYCIFSILIVAFFKLLALLILTVNFIPLSKTKLFLSKSVKFFHNRVGFHNIVGPSRVLISSSSLGIYLPLLVLNEDPAVPLAEEKKHPTYLQKFSCPTLRDLGCKKIRGYNVYFNPVEKDRYVPQSTFFKINDTHFVTMEYANQMIGRHFASLSDYGDKPDRAYSVQKNWKDIEIVGDFRENSSLLETLDDVCLEENKSNESFTKGLFNTMFGCLSLIFYTAYSKDQSYTNIPEKP